MLVGQAVWLGCAGGWKSIPRPALSAGPPLPGIVDRTDDDQALILYISATTGTPKGAELSHRNLATNTATTAETLLQVGPDDVLFGGLPLCHAFGQTCAMRLVAEGGAEVPPGEVGEIAIRGENVMTGYWNRPEATEEAISDGWFRSGDLARVDEDGFYSSSTARRT